MANPLSNVVSAIANKIKAIAGKIFPEKSDDDRVSHHLYPGVKVQPMDPELVRILTQYDPGSYKEEIIEMLLGSEPVNPASFMAKFQRPKSGCKPDNFHKKYYMEDQMSDQKHEVPAQQGVETVVAEQPATGGNTAGNGQPRISPKLKFGLTVGGSVLAGILLGLFGAKVYTRIKSGGTSVPAKDTSPKKIQTK
jgi:hypothetical protein